MTREPRAPRGRRSGLIPVLPRPAWVVLGGHFVSAVGWLAGRRRTTGAALAAAAWGISWAVVLAAGHLGGGAAEAAFITAVVIFAVGECLLSPTLPAIVNDLAPPGAAGRYNGLGVLAITTGFLLGPASGGVALGAGRSTGLFTALTVACAGASLAAYRLARYLPAAANQIPAPAAPDDRPLLPGNPGDQVPGSVLDPVA